MTTIPRQQAVDRLSEAVKNALPDDLAEIHNELFPATPIVEEQAERDPHALVGKIIEHIESGLEVQEILDLWKVIFPKHHFVDFDEENGLVHYDEKVEAVGQSDS
jgi:hypothetical protein